MTKTEKIIGIIFFIMIAAGLIIGSCGGGFVPEPSNDTRAYIWYGSNSLITTVIKNYTFLDSGIVILEAQDGRVYYADQTHVVIVENGGMWNEKVGYYSDTLR